MINLICVALILAVTGCASCKSSDTVEQCRTKQRDKSQKNSSLVAVSALDNRVVAPTTLPSPDRALQQQASSLLRARRSVP